MMIIVLKLKEKLPFNKHLLNASPILTISNNYTSKKYLTTSILQTWILRLKEFR